METLYDEVMHRRRNRLNLWDNARLLMADVPLDRTKAARALPLGMWPGSKPRATLFIVDYTSTSFTVPYHEAAMLIHVRTPLGRGLHCNWMIVDDDTALIYGRELLGFPKKMGAFTFTEKGNAVKASVTRRGVTVLSMSGALGAKHAKPLPFFDRKIFNVSGMGQWFLFNPIWLLRTKENIRESRAAEVSLTAKESEFDPIASMISGPPENGRMVVLDIISSRYLVPVGLAGPFWFSRNFRARFR